jgi:hypothetical protein
MYGTRAEGGVHRARMQLVQYIAHSPRLPQFEEQCAVARRESEALKCAVKLRDQHRQNAMRVPSTCMS